MRKSGRRKRRPPDPPATNKYNNTMVQHGGSEGKGTGNIGHGDMGQEDRETRDNNT